MSCFVHPSSATDIGQGQKTVWYTMNVLKAFSLDRPSDKGHWRNDVTCQISLGGGRIVNVVSRHREEEDKMTNLTFNGGGRHLCGDERGRGGGERGT